MGNRIYIPASKPEDWQRLLADPETQWQTGYSAKAIAYAWQEADGFPAEIQRVFSHSDYPVFQNIELLLAIPEYKVSLPGGGRPSQNDIFVLAKGNDQLISITVEGKVAESFGPLVSEWYRDPSEGKKERFEYLCKILNLDRALLKSLRYQLLHRTASALIEAERFNATIAVMLVQSFSKDDEWFADFADFASVYGLKPEVNRIDFATEIENIKLFLGWVRGEDDGNS